MTCAAAIDEESCEGSGLSRLVECVTDWRSDLDPCRWDAANDDCDLPTSVIVDAIANSAEGDSGGVCAFFVALSESQCFAIADEDECIEDERCEYESASGEKSFRRPLTAAVCVLGCSTSEDYLASVALSADADLEAELEERVVECAILATQAECEA